MQTKNKTVRVRFGTNQGTIESSAGHQVRTPTERAICDWLTGRGIVHRHASEVFIVKSTLNGSPLLFVPDVVLAKPGANSGKTIVIETLHNFSPKRGGLKTFTAFCRQYKEDYYSILVAKKANLQTIPKGLCNAHVPLENLDALARRIRAASSA